MTTHHANEPGRCGGPRTTTLRNSCRIAALGLVGLGLTLSSPAFADGGPASTLLQNQVLFPGQGLVSDSCYYHLDMQSDGNLVQYYGMGNAPAQSIWSSMQQYDSGFRLPGESSPTTGPAPNALAILQTDGNFVWYPEPALSDAIWAAGTNKGVPDQFWLQNDGNMVIRNQNDDSALWWTQAWGVTQGPSPCPLTSHVTEIQTDSDLNGQNLWSGCTNEYLQCGEWCTANAACLAWTWTPPGAAGSCSSSEGQCWLKDTQGTGTYAPGMTSGVIQSFTPGVGNVTPGMAGWPAFSQIVGAGSGLCLDVVDQATAPGSRVEIEPCNDSSSQVWTLNSAGELQQEMSGLCLNVIGGATSPGSLLQLWGCTGTANELWNLSSTGELEGAGSGLCLNVVGGANVAGTPVQIWSCEGNTANEIWNAAASLVELKGQGSNLCLNVDGGATTAGSGVIIWSCTGATPNEVWTMNARHEIVGQGSQLCLDVTGGGTAEGTPVEIWQCTGNPNQQWTLTPQGELQGVGSGLCLDVDGGQTASGTGLEIWPCHDGSNQVWTPILVPAVNGVLNYFP